MFLKVDKMKNFESMIDVLKVFVSSYNFFIHCGEKANTTMMISKRGELRGMLLMLKNMTTDNNVYYLESEPHKGLMSFGYYDENGIDNIIVCD